MPPQKWSEFTQSCPSLGNPVHCSPPGFSVLGILQARTLEWVAISFSRGSSRPRDWTQVSCIASRLFNLWATREAQCLHRRPSDTQRQVWLSLLWVSWVLVHTGFVCVLQVSLAGMRFGFKRDCTPPPAFCSFSIALAHGVSFFGGSWHSPVSGCSVASCNFGVLAGEGECMSLYSTALDSRFLGNCGCS